MRSYASSIDWLRASIVSSENLRRSIDPRLDPQRWATVNSDLCYNYRLLGDHDENAAEYRAASNVNSLPSRPAQREVGVRVLATAVERTSEQAQGVSKLN